MNDSDKLNKSYYAYDLPKELIAQDPLEDRSSSRLLLMDRRTGVFKDDHFYRIGEYLKSGDVLVVNDTKVIPARLMGEREGTGAVIEVLLLKRRENDIWETLVRPGKKARPGTRILFGGGLLKGEVLDVVEEGNRLIQFSYEGIFEEVLDSLGEMPLPPYITHKLAERERYNTVYAKYEGSAAAPTAGLHFTESLMKDLKGQGVEIAPVTLHVGLGTFRPVKEDNILNHHMHTEWYQITEETADTVNRAKTEGRRVIAVGTTSCRTLEAAALDNGRIVPGSAETDIFIYPGYDFRIIDGLITNFHLPESTLMMLVSAFAGRDHIMNAYRHAVEERYRFFSFGDAMFLY